MSGARLSPVSWTRPGTGQGAGCGTPRAPRGRYRASGDQHVPCPGPRLGDRVRLRRLRRGTTASSSCRPRRGRCCASEPPAAGVVDLQLHLHWLPGPHDEVWLRTRCRAWRTRALCTRIRVERRRRPTESTAWRRGRVSSRLRAPAGTNGRPHARVERPGRRPCRSRPGRRRSLQSCGTSRCP